MEEEPKKFEPYPIRSIRASDKSWKKFKEKRNKSGLTWDKFLLEMSKDKER